MISIVLFSAFVGLALGGSCPSDPTAIAPCVCTGDRIECKTYNNDLDLEEIFATLSQGRNPGDQQFEYFELNSNTIEELPADVFQGVWFRQILLNFNPKLACVHPRAFNGMEQFTTRFLSTFTNFSTLDTTTSSRCNLFGALSDLRILEIVNITGSEITEIPERAFHGTGGRQEHLNWINFSSGQGGSITKISRNAFSELKNIRYIDLSSHKITIVDTFAFSFTEPNDNDLIISLEHNTGMTGDSFGSSAFGVGNRKTTLKLGGNPTLKFLKEDPFHQFLENKANGKNTIDLQGSYLDYYYENEWMFEYKASLNLVDKITNAFTVDGQSLWLTPKKKYSITPTTVATTLAGNATTLAHNGTTKNTTNPFFDEEE